MSTDYASPRQMVGYSLFGAAITCGPAILILTLNAGSLTRSAIAWTILLYGTAGLVGAILRAVAHYTSHDHLDGPGKLLAVTAASGAMIVAAWGLLYGNVDKLLI